MVGLRSSVELGRGRRATCCREHPAERARRSARSRSGRTSPGISSYAGMPGCVPKNCSSIVSPAEARRTLAEQPDQRRVEVAVAALHAELAELVGAGTRRRRTPHPHPRVAPAELGQPQRRVAGERCHRVGEHLADVGPRVDREARRQVGVGHVVPVAHVVPPDVRAECRSPPQRRCARAECPTRAAITVGAAGNSWRRCDHRWWCSRPPTTASGERSRRARRGCSTATASAGCRSPRGCAARARAEVPVLTKPSRVPPGARVVSRGAPRSVGAVAAVAGPQAARPVRHARGEPRRHLAAAAPRRRAARADLHQARPDHLERRGPVPARARQRVQAVPRPGAGRAVRRPSARSSRPTSAAASRTCSPSFDTHAAGGRVDRPGARGHAAHRRGGRRQGAAAERVDVRAQGPARDGVARAAPRRPHPDRRRWPTRRRSSSCSPRRSSRSSTSGWKRRT